MEPHLVVFFSFKTNATHEDAGLSNLWMVKTFQITA